MKIVALRSLFIPVSRNMLRHFAIKIVRRAISVNSSLHTDADQSTVPSTVNSPSVSAEQSTVPPTDANQSTVSPIVLSPEEIARLKEFRASNGWITNFCKKETLLQDWL